MRITLTRFEGRSARVVEKENLYPFDRGAFAAMLEYGCVRRGGETR